jgi:hypothetical protein
MYKLSSPDPDLGLEPDTDPDMMLKIQDLEKGPDPKKC